MPTFKAILFDFDGVIVHSEPLHWKAFLIQSQRHGIEFPRTFDAYQSSPYIGFDDRDAFRKMFAPRELSATEIDELVEEKGDLFTQLLLEDGDSSIPGALDLWDELDANGIPWGICSGATQRDIRETLEILNRAEQPAFVVAADDVAISKPDPETYLKGIDKLRTTLGESLQPTEVLAIEDTTAGLTSARKAGLRILALPTSLPRDTLLELQLADVVHTEPQHLTLSALQNLFS